MTAMVFSNSYVVCLVLPIVLQEKRAGEREMWHSAQHNKKTAVCWPTPLSSANGEGVGDNFFILIFIKWLPGFYKSV